MSGMREAANSGGEGIGNIADAAADKAKDVAGAIKERTSGALGAAHDQIGDLQATVADALDSSAEGIRDRLGTTRGGVVAERLERSALWLRETDLADVGSIVRNQLRNHPARSALVALAMGILIGRATRD